MYRFFVGLTISAALFLLITFMGMDGAFFQFVFELYDLFSSVVV